MRILGPMLVGSAALAGAVVLSLFVDPPPDRAVGGAGSLEEARIGAPQAGTGAAPSGPATAGPQGPAVADGGAPSGAADPELFRARAAVLELGLDPSAVDPLRDLLEDRRDALRLSSGVTGAAKQRLEERVERDLRESLERLVGSDRAVQVAEWLERQG